MRTLSRSVLCLGLLAIACGDGLRWEPLPAPSQIPPPPSGTDPPSPFPGSPFSERYTPITVGQVVTGRVAADDPRCVGDPAFQCQYFRITAPSDGLLAVALTAAGGNVDLSVTNSAMQEWWAPIARVPVTAGATYQITLWEYEEPGVQFELRSSLQPG